MKIVVNKCFGGFSISEKVRDALGLDSVYDEVDRTDPNEASGRAARLRIVNIPDNSTDWEIDEYDGAEGVLFVVNGKIGHA